MATIPAHMRQRYDTAADWTATDPTLAAGEIGVESDTAKFKVGDGTTAWTSLGYGVGVVDIAVLAEKVSPVSADLLLIEDSAAGAQKKVQVGNLPGGGGGGGDITLIDEVDLASAAAAITFSSIPTTYTDLVVRGMLRSDRTGASTDQVTVRVGNSTVDTGTNYEWVQRTWTSGGFASLSGASASSFTRTANIATADDPANKFSTADFRFSLYADSSLYRAVSGTSWTIIDVGTPAWSEANFAGLWSNTASAIDIVTFAPNFGSNFVAGSSLALYGVG